MDLKKVIAGLTLEEKCSLFSGKTQFTTKGVERLGIPPIFLSDGPHGVRKQAGATDHLGLNPSVPATCYPTAATVANAWDTALAEELGEHLGAEAAAQNVSVLLGPGLNIKRNPLCGRNFEYFSEDPYLSGKLAAAYVRGIQSQGVAACPKHYAVNSQETFRMASDSVVDQRAMHEIYLTGFELAVTEGKPLCLMSSYNKVNGEYANDSELLLQRLLIDTWGFGGFVVTDWGGSNDRVQGLIAGNHLEMPATKGNSDREILAAVQQGRVSEAFLDQRLEELLSVLLNMNLGERDGSFDVEAHHGFARTVAEASIVLLKNEGEILPLAPKTKVALIGPFAKTPRYQGAGSSLVNSTKLDSLFDCMGETAFELVGYAEGCTRTGGADEAMRQSAVALAKEADVVLLTMGLDEIAETEGLERGSMRLHDNQVALLKAVSEVNSNVVVVLSAGSPIEMPWSDTAKAIVHGYLGGQAGAGAMLRVVSGAVNPSGKLAETYPERYGDVPSAVSFPAIGPTSEYRESIFVGYRYFDTAELPVKFPFGFGLSYTTFAYSNLTCNEDGVSLTVENTGKRAGSEIVQLYISPEQTPGLFRAKQELKGFAKVFLQQGEARQVSIPLDDKAFRYYNVQTRQFEVAQGSYAVLIGASSRDIRLRGTLEIAGTNAPLPYAGQSLPSYESGQVGSVPDEEFAALLGRPIPPSDWDRRAPIGLNDPIARLKDAKNPLARLIFRIIEGKKVKAEQSGKPDLNILFIYNMPFRGIAKMMGGMVDMPMVHAMLTVVNGHFFRGCGQLLGAFRRMKKAQKEGIS